VRRISGFGRQRQLRLRPSGPPAYNRCMSSGQTGVQALIDRGIEAYRNLSLSEAAQNFEAAVALDAQSVDARLSLGVLSFMLYENGLGSSPPRIRRPAPNAPQAELAAYLSQFLDHLRASIAEQNSTNGPRAEENLKHAVQLDPRNKMAMSYLTLLYDNWLDTERHHPRRAEAQQWCQRILAVDPGDKFATYASAVIYWHLALDILASSRIYQQTAPDEEARQSLEAQAGPLLENSARNFQRWLEMDPASSDPVGYLVAVRNAQAHAFGTDDDRLQARREADEWRRKVNEIHAARAKAAGQPWPAGPMATVTFTAVRGPASGKPAPEPFPPDPLRLIPPAPPPPPPAPPAPGVSK